MGQGLLLYLLGLLACLGLLHLACLALIGRLKPAIFTVCGALCSVGLGLLLLADSLVAQLRESWVSASWPLLLIPGLLVVGSVLAGCWAGVVSLLVTTSKRSVP